MRRPAPAELRALAAEHGFRLTAAEESQYAQLADALLEAIDALERQEPAALPPLEAQRDAGRPPRAEEDPLNAIVRWCDVRAPDGDGLLAGKRIAVKDAVAVAGVPLSAGSRVLEGFVPQADAVVTERILRAGGAIVAVTTMDDLAAGAGGDSGAHGPVRNPFDPARTAGGSSSGAAAALHYDAIDASVGCDQAGSIRVPAAWCGVLGLKPTYALVPYTGVVGTDRAVDHCGPLGRTVFDVAALLEAMSGPDASDPRQHPAIPAVDCARAVAEAPGDLAGVAIGVVEEGFSEQVGIDPRVAAAVEAAVERIAALGATVRRVSVPEHLQGGGVSFAGFLEGMPATLASGGNGHGWHGRYWSDLAAALGSGLRERAGELSPQVKVTLMLGGFLRRETLGGLYAKAANLRPWLTAAYDRALDGLDALLLPTTPGLPHALDADLPLAERVLRGWSMLGNTFPMNLTGHPALSMPAAEAGGLPVGAMLVGPRWADARLLAIAATYERAHGWLPRRP